LLKQISIHQKNRGAAPLKRYGQYKWVKLQGQGQNFWYQ
jgi:hypothetical protein